MSGLLERRFHESTSRALCRLAFLIFGGLPLMGCFVFCFLQVLPQYQRWYASRWERELSSVFGLAIDLVAVESVTPEKSILHGVRITHPETGATIARAKSIQVVRSRGQWQVQVFKPELEGRSFKAGWQLMHETLLCRPRPNSVATRVAMQQLVIHNEGGSQLLANIVIDVYAQQNSTHLSLEFTPREEHTKASEPAETPSILIMKRLHAEEQQSTKIQFRSGSTPLPCSLVQLCWPTAANFGAHATFAGMMAISMDQQGWRIDIPEKISLPGESESRVAGMMVQQVDFGKLSWNAPAEVTGNGGLWIERAHVSQAGIDYLSGRVVMEDGRVSSKLLTALQVLGIEVAPELANVDARDRSFEQAFFQFEIAPLSLRICGAAPEGWMLRDARGTMARRSNWEQQIPLWQFTAALDGSLTTSGLQSNFSRLAHRWLPLETSEIRVSQNAVQLSTN